METVAIESMLNASFQIMSRLCSVAFVCLSILCFTQLHSVDFTRDEIMLLPNISSII